MFANCTVLLTWKNTRWDRLASFAK